MRQWPCEFSSRQKADQARRRTCRRHDIEDPDARWSSPSQLQVRTGQAAATASGRYDDGRTHGRGQGDGAARLPGQADLHPLLQPLRHRHRGDDGSAQGQAGRDPGTVLPAPAHRGAPSAHRERRYHQVPVAPLRRSPRRIRAHALPQPRHPVRVQSVRLRNELPVLRHRPTGSDQEHVHGRDRRTGHPR